MISQVIMNEEGVMNEQIYKRLTSEHAKTILSRHPAKEMTTDKAIEFLGLKRRQFFEWVQG